MLQALFDDRWYKKQICEQKRGHIMKNEDYTHTRNEATEF